MDWELDPLAGEALHDLKVPIISKTKKPELAQGESTMDNVDKEIFQEEIKEHIKENKEAR